MEPASKRYKAALVEKKKGIPVASRGAGRASRTPPSQTHHFGRLEFTFQEKGIPGASVAAISEGDSWLYAPWLRPADPCVLIKGAAVEGLYVPTELCGREEGEKVVKEKVREEKKEREKEEG